MIARLRPALHAYTSRRSPWGPPWWIYGVAFGAANLVRQGIILVTAVELPPAVQVATWVATALVVIVVVNGVAALRRRGAPSRPRRRPAPPPAVPSATEDSAAATRRPNQEKRSTRWAPWWLSLLAVIGGNHVRRALDADAATPEARVAVALAFSVAVFVLVTLTYRAIRSPSRSARRRAHE